MPGGSDYGEGEVEGGLGIGPLFDSAGLEAVAEEGEGVTGPEEEEVGAEVGGGNVTPSLPIDLSPKKLVINGK